MTLTVEAIYENGVLKPATPLPLKEQERVEVMIHTSASPSDDLAPSSRGRQEALRRLFGLQLPVADWDEMEQEIIRGAVA